MQQVQMTPDQQAKCPDDYCECGCPYFKQRYIMKRMPGLMFGSTVDSYGVMAFWACEKCGKPHKNTQFDVPKMKDPKAPEDNSNETPILKMPK